MEQLLKCTKTLNGFVSVYDMQDMSTKEFKIIRNEIRELRMLYKNLIDKIIPLEEPTSSDKSSIKKKEELVSESSLMKTLD